MLWQHHHSEGPLPEEKMHGCWQQWFPSKGIQCHLTISIPGTKQSPAQILRRHPRRINIDTWTHLRWTLNIVNHSKWKWKISPLGHIHQNQEQHHEEKQQQTLQRKITNIWDTNYGAPPTLDFEQEEQEEPTISGQVRATIQSMNSLPPIACNQVPNLSRPLPVIQEVGGPVTPRHNPWSLWNFSGAVQLISSVFNYICFLRADNVQQMENANWWGVLLKRQD